MSWLPPLWNQFGPPSPLKVSAALEPNQTLDALWVAHSDDDRRNRQFLAACTAPIGAKPQNELEGSWSAR